MATVLHPAIARRRFSLRGIVQGVGFRPFVYTLAQRIGVRGFILNSSSGVTIEAEAPDAALDDFLNSLRTEAPPLARIEHIATAELAPLGDLAFEIRKSDSVPGEFALVSNDVATCSDCWREVLDPENRRFGYPFTNCTNCGPRYTIIRDIPYDRPTTTMAAFQMCADCEAEYHDPTNRRFHAEPNACHVCGPTVALAKSGSFPPPNGSYGFGGLSLSVLADARELLHEGAILAVKGLGGFQLACDAENDTAVRQLRRRKKRSDKPFALMARDIAAVEAFCACVCRRPRASTEPAAADCDPSSPAGYEAILRHRSRKRHHRRDARLHAAALPALRRARRRPAGVHGAGDDQRQHQRRADRYFEQGSMAAARRRRRLASVPQPRHLHAGRRFGGAHLRGPSPRAAPFARIRSADRSTWARR